MKALIRNTGEIVRETDGILGIDWDTGAPLTNSEWCGGAYTLVKDYVEDREENPIVMAESMDMAVETDGREESEVEERTDRELTAEEIAVLRKVLGKS